MIYLNLLIDYLLLNIGDVCSYFILIELDKRKLIDVIICGILIDIIYLKIFYNSLIILIVYLIFKILKIKNKYVILKNILILCVYVIIREFIHIFI